METATRDARGRFLPGSSGNPAGKQPGTLNRATRLKQWLAEADEEQSARALIAQAVKGNVAALRIVFDRIDPKPRGRIITLDLPEDALLLEKFEAAFAGMAAGAITPEEALMVARFLEHQNKVIGDGDDARMREVYAGYLEAERRDEAAARAETPALEAPEPSAPAAPADAPDAGRGAAPASSAEPLHSPSICRMPPPDTRPPAPDGFTRRRARPAPDVTADVTASDRPPSSA